MLLKSRYLQPVKIDVTVEGVVTIGGLLLSRGRYYRGFLLSESRCYQGVVTIGGRRSFLSGVVTIGGRGVAIGGRYYRGGSLLSGAATFGILRYIYIVFPLQVSGT